jgi:hypothetical protein
LRLQFERHSHRPCAFALVLCGLIAGACGPSGAEEPAESTSPAPSAITASGIHGFRIAIGTNNTLQINAFGGAADGGPVRLWQNCPANNTDCTWTYRNGLILSDTNLLIGLRAPDHPVDGDHLIQSAACGAGGIVPSSCRWAYHDGHLYNIANQNLAVAAFRAAHGADVILKQNCVAGVDPICHWIFESAAISLFSSTGGQPALPVYHSLGGATDVSFVGLSSLNTADPSVTWTFIDGMIVSDLDRRLALNAFGGAGVGTQIVVNTACDVSNPDCRWNLQGGSLYSDTSGLSIVPGNTGQVPLSLAYGCGSSNCEVKLEAGGCGRGGQLPCDGATCSSGSTLLKGYCHSSDSVGGFFIPGSQYADATSKAGFTINQQGTPTKAFLSYDNRAGTRAVNIESSTLTVNSFSGPCNTVQKTTPFSVAPGTMNSVSLACTSTITDWKVVVVYAL